jgi:hypothetical protein
MGKVICNNANISCECEKTQCSHREEHEKQCNEITHETCTMWGDCSVLQVYNSSENQMIKVRCVSTLKK